MNNHDRVQYLIKELYGETIEIKPHTAVGWYAHRYAIIKPDNMTMNTFVALHKKIKNDFPETGLKVIVKHMYQDVKIGQDLSLVDKQDLHIVILTADLYKMDEMIKPEIKKNVEKKYIVKKTNEKQPTKIHKN